MQIKGKFLNKYNFDVHEITGLHRIESGITKPIEFHGNIFIEEIRSVNEVDKDKESNNNNQFLEINDIENSSSDLQPHIINAPKVAFEFLQPIFSKIKPEKMVNKATVKPINNNGKAEKGGLMTTVATDEATILGTVRKGDFDNTDDRSNKDLLYRQNFEDLLKALRGVDIQDFNDDYLELPYIPRYQLHMKSDGNERNVLQATFSFKGQKFALFEIDTTDYIKRKKRLSTLIIALNDGGFERASLEFLQGIIKNSLRWPKVNFGKKANLSHPQGFYTGKSDSKIMIENWSQRIEKVLNQLIDSE